VASRYEQVKAQLRQRPQRWLVTGAAGFIGSHLVQELLALGQQVVGLDNFATGDQANLDAVVQAAGHKASGFDFLTGDIRNPDDCARAVEGVDCVLHQAALGSVPRSIARPDETTAVNAQGFVNVLTAAKAAGISRVVYASSSSVYGDSAELPKVEQRIGAPLSPYAASKLTNEIYARVFERTYGLECVGLRYFNVFGPRQSPNGPYAAVIPRWVAALAGGEPCQIFGAGETSRDFCYVANAVEANLLAATADAAAMPGRIYNVACGEQTTLSHLFELIRDRAARRHPAAAEARAVYAAPRPGDVRHSLACIDAAERQLGYQVLVKVAAGLDLTVQ
jgi:UDP-N-acetylglucosamine/UDP-N-acetylgalactosamine 4-epimerase